MNPYNPAKPCRQVGVVATFFIDVHLFSAAFVIFTVGVHRRGCCLLKNVNTLCQCMNWALGGEREKKRERKWPGVHVLDTCATLTATHLSYSLSSTVQLCVSSAKVFTIHQALTLQCPGDQGMDGEYIDDRVLSIEY